MIVDDHPVMRRALSYVLDESADFDMVAEAGTVAGGLKAATGCEPALAIVDLRLPDGDGLDLIAQLRDARPGLRIVVFSSVDERLNAVHVRKVGAHGFVSKLRDPEELLASLRLVMIGYTCFASDLVEPSGTTLSRRETSVLHRLISGQSNVDIATSLNLSPKTVSTYKMRLMQKLDLQNVVDLVEYAKTNGLTN
ncbi:response regulator transcription factor [Paraburkholderia azotifigens]|uniref:Response regulator transcription factor n=1 Tax=Paraburkholderia azotifigens TaxID=2057004 RepID=A0A5C6VFZ0_9BURK|nr:response regulator transcription factor [Paraburkholderia azotifigens]TXC83426.1 response regulator transcription factor [Paraburkholderia azotifigens]